MTEFDQLVTPHLNELRRIIYWRMHRKLRRYIDVDDIMQEVLMYANKRLEEYKKKNIPFHIWVNKIAIDKTIEAYRFYYTKKRDISKEITEKDDNAGALGFIHSGCESPHDLAVIDENTSIIKQAINNMGEQDKEILYMRYIKRLSNREISESTGIDKRTISMRYLRALERLAAQNKNNHNLREILCRG